MQQRRRAIRWAASAAVACGVGVALPRVASAEGSATVLTDVQCDGSGSGVLDLTLVNDGSADATFVVTRQGASAPSTIVVAPGSARALTFSGLHDGPFVVPVELDGWDATVLAPVACAASQPEGIDDPQRPVEVAQEDPWAEVPGELPATGSSTGGLVLGGALVAAGSAVSLLARRRIS